MAPEIPTADVRRYLGGVSDPPWGSPQPAVSFLARGEYSLNYRVADDYVARLVTGTQIGLPLDEQALYEYHALELVSPSGSAPRPYAVDPDPPDLPCPVIIEEYLAGRPLDYASDIPGAARCVAAIHALGVPDDHGLQSHPDPGPAILEESRGLAEPYLQWPGGDAGAKASLRIGFARVEELAGREQIVPRDDLTIVHYDLNTHNFVVDDATVGLVDWEKTRIAPLTQDLAHFLLPTTTLWRDETAARLTAGQEREFLDTYLDHNPHPDRERLQAQLEAMRIMVALRAVCWCAWAVQASERGRRVIVNQETLDKVRTYLQPDFLDELFSR